MTTPSPQESSPTPRTWRRTAGVWISVLAAYWVALFTATHIPQPEALGPAVDYDKLVHIGAYFVLATLLLIAWRRTGAWPTWRGRLLVAAVALAYGAFDEITQPYFQRVGDLNDWIADGIGVVIAIGIDQWRHGSIRAISGSPTPESPSPLASWRDEKRPD